MYSRQEIELIHMLTDRLERVSVDSYWAHRASGVRGSLLQLLDSLESGMGVKESRIRNSIEMAFFILQRAAEERSA